MPGIPDKLSQVVKLRIAVNDLGGVNDYKKGYNGDLKTSERWAEQALATEQMI
ncbi:MAG: hypothetical protein Fur0021_40310 [Candidatus Promineifilaceae bacterium]